MNKTTFKTELSNSINNNPEINGYSTEIAQNISKMEAYGYSYSDYIDECKEINVDGNYKGYCNIIDELRTTYIKTVSDVIRKTCIELVKNNTSVFEVSRIFIGDIETIKKHFSPIYIIKVIELIDENTANFEIYELDAHRLEKYATNLILEELNILKSNIE